jgi:hypothetical protein
MLRSVPTDATLRPLGDLLEGIDRRSIVLPAFQRDFEWTESDVRSMVGTVLRGWPSGSLLLMRGAPAFFETRPFEDTPPDRASEIDYVVLDGQQRLTALYHAFYDRGPVVYALNLRRVQDWSSDDLEQAIVYFTRLEWMRRHHSIEDAASAGLVPLSALASSERFFSWRDGLRAWPAAEATRLTEAATEAYSRVVGGAENYRFPAVVLDPALEPSEIAGIFERLNRTGRSLTTFDLVVARSYEPVRWNLRDAWEDARAELPMLTAFLQDDGLPVLQTIALLELGNVRQSAVLALTPETIRSQWAHTCLGVAEASRFLSERCGAPGGEWLPYRVMMLPLAALASTGLLDQARDIAERWFWETAFGLQFEVAANTEIVASYRLLEQAIRRNEVAVFGHPLASVLLRATRRRPSAVWRAFACALLANDARDLSGEPVQIAIEDGGRAISPDVVPTPVLPPSDDEFDPPMHHRVLATVLVHRSARAVLRKSGVAALDASDQAPLSLTHQGLRSQFVPPRPPEDPMAFLIARLTLLSEFLQGRGASVEWDSTGELNDE